MVGARGPHDGRLWAAALLGAGLLWAGMPVGSAGRPTPCASPRELATAPGEPARVACGPGASRAAAPVRGPVGLLFGGRLDLNRADPSDLQVLPGIGPQRARAIVRARCERPFRGLADLERVRGIGPRTRARLAGWAEVRAPRARGCEPTGRHDSGAGTDRQRSRTEGKPA